MMGERIELQPCPWCKNDPRGPLNLLTFTAARSLLCKVCGAQGPTVEAPLGTGAIMTQGIAAWNRRTELSALEAQDAKPIRTYPSGDPVTDTLSWALDMIDMYDERLAGIDGRERVYTPIHVEGKRVARRVLKALEEANYPDPPDAPALHREPSKGPRT